MLGWIIIWLFVLFHYLKKFATETSICFLFPFSPQIALLSVLLSFHFFSFEISYHQLMCYMIYWLCFPPCSVANMALLTLLSGVARRSCVRAVLPSVSGGRKAHSGPANNWHPTLFSSALSTVLELDELIYFHSTRKVQGRRHSANQRNNQRLICMHCWL